MIHRLFVKTRQADMYTGFYPGTMTETREMNAGK